MKAKVSSNPKSNFSSDKKPLYDDEWIFDVESCTSCGRPVSEHDSSQAVRCALSLIEGVTG